MRYNVVLTLDCIDDTASEEKTADYVLEVARVLKGVVPVRCWYRGAYIIVYPSDAKEKDQAAARVDVLCRHHVAQVALQDPDEEGVGS